MMPCRRDVIRDSARREFEAARFETDPAVVRAHTRRADG